jgi:hypothetical protein
MKGKQGISSSQNLLFKLCNIYEGVYAGFVHHFLWLINKERHFTDLKILLVPNTLAGRSMSSLLERWDRGFEFHSKH